MWPQVVESRGRGHQRTERIGGGLGGGCRFERYAAGAATVAITEGDGGAVNPWEGAGSVTAAVQCPAGQP